MATTTWNPVVSIIKPRLGLLFESCQHHIRETHRALCKSLVQCYSWLVIWYNNRWVEKKRGDRCQVSSGPMKLTPLYTALGMGTIGWSERCWMIPQRPIIYLESQLGAWTYRCHPGDDLSRNASQLFSFKLTWCLSWLHLPSIPRPLSRAATLRRPLRGKNQYSYKLYYKQNN